MELAQITEPLLGWYAKNARILPWREDVTPYHVWVSEIMLQQTRVEAVKGYYLRFTSELPDIASLAGATEQQLLKLWEGLGYYNRVRNLQKAAQMVMERYGGELPASYEELLTLPGIGPYTAGAVASIAYGIPVPAVDGNVLRVISRLRASYADIADPKVKRGVEDDLRGSMPQGHAGAFNQSLMELGATVCVPNGPPNCAVCPVHDLCEGRKLGIAIDLPVKTAKKPRRIEDRTVLLLVRDDMLAIRKRKDKGLLAGLWELPSLAGHLDNTNAIEVIRKWGLEPLRVEALGEAKHIFTHIEWQMTGLRVTVEESHAVDGLTWVDPKQLRDKYPIPSAFRSYLAAY
ncbi:A/G-specific adenine glycosylase [Oscillospiraceae bacterium PP1C4]